MKQRNYFHWTITFLPILLLAGCGDSEWSALIGGSVAGLLPGTSVVLQNNGGDSTPLTTNGAFTFSRLVAGGSPYTVTVLTQPFGQTCVVHGGSGTLVATNKGNVSVICSANAYPIGVTVAGLTGTGLVLRNNGGDDLSISASGSVNFSKSISSGSPYNVTILTQPPGQLCSISNGTGMVGAAAISVAVKCVALPNAWNWMGGASVAGASGVYGTLGVAAAANIPGARYGAVSWTDAAGNAWLLGGEGYDSVGTVGALNDLWEYSAGQWKWVNGANTVSAPGTYGTKGIAAAGNIPGARFAAVSWIDSSGNVWLAGGQGYDSAGSLGLLNDLWEYSAGQWRWVSGDRTANASGTYGIQGTAAAGNIPGARFASNSWVDVSGHLWLFGGIGNDSAGTQGFLNDMWEYDAGQWKWVSGSNTVSAPGTYGTQGVAAPGNVPGARLRAISWNDSSGNVWLFGGLGFDSAGAQGALNDLWEYSAGQWKWVSGSNMINAGGSFGTKGTPATRNEPAARYAAISWTDSAGNAWLFGGQGEDAAGNPTFLSDLWRYRAGEWTWVSGSNTINSSGAYGTKGIAATGNGPGARYAGISWIDASGRLWLFGGLGYDSAGAQGGLNDLWTYTP